MPPEQAFVFEAIAGDGNTILMRFTPAKGYYLYRDRNTSDRRRRRHRRRHAEVAQGVAHRDEHFGEVTVYFDQVDVPAGAPQRARCRRVTLTTTFGAARPKASAIRR